MNFKNKLLTFFFFLLILPINALAYSEYVIPGGENIGISIQSDGVLIVGFYPVNHVYIGKEAGFEIGDRVTMINGVKVDTIEQMIKEINKTDKTNVKIGFVRNGKNEELTLSLKEEEQTFKTGLYVKDQITGIGTLTYIDPNTKIYGALGHEIIEKSTLQRFEIKDGKIFKSEVTGIVKSERGTPGEKNARFYSNETYGNIKENESSGIFGTYHSTLPSKELVKIANPKEIKTGDAIIQTVLEDNTIEQFHINILKIDQKSDVKNILFEITDQALLEKTGGVVQGMSGSPILQDNKLIGAVTHVIVNDSKKGYGIFITTMLEEGEN